ncbi:MAG: hypothetical protein CSB23_01000 [Deltaproteobacteria bacterium]|nr:MAG: hypothetical protein CSB23_01000 [Deltaproteobacteria bacterium]
MSGIGKILSQSALLFLLPFCFPAFFCSCAMMSDPPSMQHSCRGFDFNKKFPRIRKGEKFLGVEYDTNVKRLTNRDGLHFMKDDFDPPEWNGEDSLTMRRTPEELRVLLWPMDPYNYCDLALSKKEKSYIAAFDARERAFDRQYAGEIKRKLLPVL